MIIVGVICLLLGLLLPVPYPVGPILLYGGVILIVVGIVFLFLGGAGRPVGGRRNWW